MHIGVGMLPVDRGQVQRALPGHLQKLASLGLRLLRLVTRNPNQPTSVRQRNDDDQAEQHRRPARFVPAGGALSAPRPWSSAFGLGAGRLVVRLGSGSVFYGHTVLHRVVLGGVCHCVSSPAAATSIAMSCPSARFGPGRIGCTDARRVPYRCRWPGRTRRRRWAAAPAGSGGPGRTRRRSGRQLRDVLPGQGGVGVAFPVVAVVERHVLLVAFAHLHRWCALAGHGFTRDVARAAHVERRVLRHPAVQVAGRAVRVVLERGDRAAAGPAGNPVVHGGGRLRLRLKLRY